MAIISGVTRMHVTRRSIISALSSVPISRSSIAFTFTKSPV